MRENAERRIAGGLLTIVAALVLGLGVACAGNQPDQATDEPEVVAEQPATTPAANNVPEAPAIVTEEPATEASVPRVTAQELHESMANDEVIVIDVRSSTAYAAAHIPGSLHIPLVAIEGQLQSLPKGKKIVTYCT